MSEKKENKLPSVKGGKVKLKRKRDANRLSSKLPSPTEELINEHIRKTGMSIIIDDGVRRKMIPLKSDNFDVSQLTSTSSEAESETEKAASSDSVECPSNPSPSSQFIKNYINNWGAKFQKVSIYEPRKIYFKTDCINSVKGSAYVEYGETKVLAEVIGTKECSQEAINRFELDCVVTYAFPSVNLSEFDDKRISTATTVIKNAILPIICRDKLINSCIEIRVTVVDDNGCAISTAITAVGLALVNAGVPVFSIITAATSCYMNGKEIPNPTIEMEEAVSLVSKSSAHENVEEYGIVITSMMLSERHITNCYQKGYLLPSLYEKIIEHNISICECLIDVIRMVITKELDAMDESEVIKKVERQLTPISSPQSSDSISDPNSPLNQNSSFHRKHDLPYQKFPKKVINLVSSENETDDD